MQTFKSVHQLYVQCFPSVCEKKHFTGDSGGIRTHDLLLTSANVLFTFVTLLVFGIIFDGAYFPSDVPSGITYDVTYVFS